jgi:hypothetical protein
MSYFHDENEITVCGCHDTDVQLIWTFAFPYHEFWCPACGAHYGMVGAGRNAKWNWRIHNQYVKDLEQSRRFLTANGILCCAMFKYKGTYIKPLEMPEKLRKYYERESKKWKYRIV